MKNFKPSTKPPKGALCACQDHLGPHNYAGGGRVGALKSAAEALRVKMLAALKPIGPENVSAFEVLGQGMRAPTGRDSDIAAALYGGEDRPYPVYHGARELFDAPLEPRSQAHNDLTAFLGERKDPRALLYTSTNPITASLHAAGLSDISESPNLRAYVGRGLPSLSMYDFSNFDIAPEIRKLSRVSLSELYRTVGVWQNGLTAPYELSSKLREFPELAKPTHPELAQAVAEIKARHLAGLPKNYLQRMTDFTGYSKLGDVKQKVSWQPLFTDPAEAMRKEQLIPVRGNYASGGAVTLPRGAKPSGFIEPMAEGLGGLWDMLAGTARGAATATVGLPGDLIELADSLGLELGRLGKRLDLPTSEDLSRTWRPLTGLSIPPETNSYEKLGQYAPVPVVPNSAVRGAKTLGRGALSMVDDAMRGEGPLRGALAPAAPAYAVRPRGGNFNQGRLDNYLGAGEENLDQGARIVRDRNWANPYGPMPGDEERPVTLWANKQLRNYIAKDLGAPTDPLLAVEKEYPNLHLPEETLADMDYSLNSINSLRGHDISDRNSTRLQHMPDGFIDHARAHQALTDEPLTRWGRFSDPEIYPQSPAEYKDELLGGYGQGPDDTLNSLHGNKYDWLDKTSPDTKIWGLYSPGDDNLGFGHVLDYLDAATAAHTGSRDFAESLAGMRAGTYAGTPEFRQVMELSDAGLTLDPASLQRLSVADAVKKTAQWNEFLASKGAESGPLSQGWRVHKDYGPEGGGMKWVEFGKPEFKPFTKETLPPSYELHSEVVGNDIPNVELRGKTLYGVRRKDGAAPTTTQDFHNHPGLTEEDALKNFNEWSARSYGEPELRTGLKAEGDSMGHCVGGYCDSVARGDTKIYSLRDAQGKPHVTIETRAGRDTRGEADYMAEIKRMAEEEPANSQLFGEWLAKVKKQDPMFQSVPGIKALNIWRKEFAGLPELPVSEPLPEIVQIKGKSNAAPVEKYLPQVQDFVKSQKWGRVGDLGNTGLIEFRGGKTKLRGGDPAHYGMLAGTEYEMPKGLMTPSEAAQFLIDQGAPEAWARNHVGDYLRPDIRNARGPGYASGGRVTNTQRGENAGGMLDALGGLWDMGAGTLRGATAATLGLPGDAFELADLLGLEIGRLGKKVGLPTSESLRKSLPPLTGLSISPETNSYQTLGEFMPLPVPVSPVVRGAKGVAKGALGVVDAAMRGEGPLRGALAPVAPAYAVRPRGGNFRDPTLDELGGWIPENVNGQQNPNTKWADTVLRNYIKRDLGAPTDPLLQVEREFPNLHLPEGDLHQGRQMFQSDVHRDIHNSLTNNAPLTPWGARSDTYLSTNLSGQDLALELSNKWPLANLYPDYPRVEDSGAKALQDLAGHTDNIIERFKPFDYSTDVMSLKGYRQQLKEAMESDWRAKKTEDNVYSLRPTAGDALGFNHIMDYLDAATDPYTTIKQNFGDHSRTPGGTSDYKDAVNQFLEGPGFAAFEGVHPYRATTVEDWRAMHRAGLTVDPESLQRMSVPDVVRKVAAWNEYMANKKGASSELSQGWKVHKDYGPEGGGMKWVEFGKPQVPSELTEATLPEGYKLTKKRNEGLPEDHSGAYSYWVSDAEDKAPSGDLYGINNESEKAMQAFWHNYTTEPVRKGLKAEGDAMGHCVGGYCDDVLNNGTRVYSLRDAKGAPHVTIEVRPGKFRLLDFEPVAEEKMAWEADLAASNIVVDPAGRYVYGPGRGGAVRGSAGSRVDDSELATIATNRAPNAAAKAVEPPEVVQIKGKGNAAPVEKYLPQVQDFVKSQKWGRVGDLKNTGLQSIGGKLFTKEELKAAYDQAGYKIPFDALGMNYFDMLATTNGMAADTADRAFMRALGFTQEIDGRPYPLAEHNREPRGYAHGGSVQPAEEDPQGFLPRTLEDYVDIMEKFSAMPTQRAA